MTPQRNVLLFECLGYGVPVWNEASDAVRLGQLVAAAIAAGLAAPGPFSVEPLAAHGDFGWEFDVVYGATRIRCLLQRSDAWLLITEPRRDLADRRQDNPFEADHAHVCAELDRVVRALPAASDLQWMTLEEFRAGPSGR
jgi:hypothetical protein